MRAGLLRVMCALVLAAAGALAFSLGQSQERPAPPPGGVPQAPPAASPAKLAATKVQLARLTVFQRQLYLGAQRGAEWLQRANRVDGRFQPGLVPALRRPLESDHYLRQAGADNDHFREIGRAHV